MVGRYMKRISIDYDSKIKKGCYLKIIDVDSVYYHLDLYGKCYKDTYLFELMSEGFTPEQNNSLLQNLVIW